MIRRSLARTRLLPVVVILGACVPATAQDAKVVGIENRVETSLQNGPWKPARVGQTLAISDQIWTKLRSRATVQLTDLYTMRLDQLTTVKIVPQIVSGERPKLNLRGGKISIFSRAPAREIDIETPTVNATSLGTQFVVEVGKGGRTEIAVFEGTVHLANEHGRLELGAGEAGEALAGQAPRRTARIVARSILQWALYYPAVLEIGDLGMSNAERRKVAHSLEAYQEGDLLGALARYPAHDPVSAAGKLYKANVLLAVGRVDEARTLMVQTPAAHPGRRALERMIEAVRLGPEEVEARVDLRFFSGLDEGKETARQVTASEALAESYFQQAAFRLPAAREAALRATRLAPENGYAWTRLAELEFSSGDNVATKAALDRALALTPRNAQAFVLQGFVLAGRHRVGEAEESFETAIRLDGALGNGWLGRGLSKIRRGELASGRADLQVAATVEPTVAHFHSYLGKAFGEEGERVRAAKDLERARELDPRDPTPWLYSAIEQQRRNQPNRAIDDLERSIELNDNRRLYRSRFLLDQDRAVRSANLAMMFQNAGMTEVAVREATRAVESDYTNPSAHLFLANSFDALRDPNRILLRYETPWFNELLLANLLSPVGGGPLSQFVSQQEYSRLFASNGLGGSVLGEWRSDSEVRTTASLFGTYGSVSFGIDANYREFDGYRPNAQSSLAEFYAHLKWQVTPDDIVYLLGKWQDQESGDQFQTFDNRSLAPGLAFDERQEPGLLLAGWNHRWAPGVHTLVLGGYLSAEQRLRDPSGEQFVIRRTGEGLRPEFIRTNAAGTGEEFSDPGLRAAFPAGVPTGPDGESLVYNSQLVQGIAPFLGSGAVLNALSWPFDFDTRREIEMYSAEVQHVVQHDRNTLLLGGRLQGGELRTEARLSAQRPSFVGGFSTPASDQVVSADFLRTSLYAYDYWTIVPDLMLIGGVSWDRIEHPLNFRNPPLSDGTTVEDQVSGKYGFTYSPSRWVTLGGTYARGLGGVTFDESVRLEPVQLAGFNQSYRTVISESLAGSVETPEFTIWGGRLEGELPTRTWWGIDFNVIEQEVDRTIGVFTGYDTPLFAVEPAYFVHGMPQRLSYRERSFRAVVNQLIGDQLALGASYRLTRSELEQRLPELVDELPGADIEDAATLHEFSVFADWNSPAGLFAHVEGNWYSQDLDDDPNGAASAGPRDGDDFFQLNAVAGYRFDENRGEVSAGLLNVLDTDYRLSPLNPYNDLPRERTMVLRCRWSF